MPKAPNRSDASVRFGLILKAVRLRRGWTLVYLSDRCGMNPHYLGALEKGYNTPTLDTILLLARTFKVKASDLMLELEEASKGLQIVE